MTPRPAANVVTEVTTSECNSVSLRSMRVEYMLLLNVPIDMINGTSSMVNSASPFSFHHVETTSRPYLAKRYLQVDNPCLMDSSASPGNYWALWRREHGSPDIGQMLHTGPTRTSS